jgi:hypothetical protein
MATVGSLPVKISWDFKYDPIALGYTVYLVGMVEYLMWLLREGNR